LNKLGNQNHSYKIKESADVVLET